jgi:hypothetical protein
MKRCRNKKEGQKLFFKNKYHIFDECVMIQKQDHYNLQQTDLNMNDFHTTVPIVKSDLQNSKLFAEMATV